MGTAAIDESIPMPEPAAGTRLVRVDVVRDGVKRGPVYWRYPAAMSAEDVGDDVAQVCRRLGQVGVARVDVHVSEHSRDRTRVLVALF